MPTELMTDNNGQPSQEPSKHIYDLHMCVKSVKVLLFMMAMMVIYKCYKVTVLFLFNYDKAGYCLYFYTTAKN